MASELDVYAPNEPGPWPVVVLVHGAFQTRRALWKLIDAIASQGAVVYSLDVEHSFPYATSSFERIACGVRFARATAADYGGDHSWITLFGYSAGAHGGAVIALAGDEFAGDCVVVDEPALVDAFVAYEGPYDWTTTVYHNNFDFTNLKNEDPELWHAINPNSQIGQNPELQVRLLHGDAEDIEWYDVPLEVSIEFYKALTEAGYDVALIVAEGGTHGAIIDSSEVIALTVGQVMELAHSSSE
jgi:acetyl esterase/lipase